MGIITDTVGSPVLESSSDLVSRELDVTVFSVGFGNRGTEIRSTVYIEECTSSFVKR